MKPTAPTTPSDESALTPAQPTPPDITANGKPKRLGKFELQDRFIELRAKGYSFDDIADQLGIAKNTALSWACQHAKKISSARAIAIDELLEKFAISKTRRLEVFGAELNRILAELRRRDLTDVPTGELYKLAIRHLETLREEMPIIELEKRLKDAEESWD